MNISKAQMQAFYKNTKPKESDPSKDKRGNPEKCETRRKVEAHQEMRRELKELDGLR